MALERVYGEVERGIADPLTGSDELVTLRQIKALVDKRRSNAEARAQAQTRKDRLAAEARAIGERVGIPLAQFLVEKGVTTATPIRVVVPRRITSRKKTGLLEVPIVSGKIAGLNLEPVDVGLAIQALNRLDQTIKDGQFYARIGREQPLTESSIMADVIGASQRRFSGAGPKLSAILHVTATHLPFPKEAPVQG